MNDTVWHYNIPSKNLEGWAQIFLTSRGVFSAVSDWGNYGYIWSGSGCDDVREFFVRDDWGDYVDYFVSKFEPEKVYDGEATESALREFLEESGWDEDTISELFFNHDLDTEVGFARLVEDEDLGGVDSYGLHTCAKYTPSRQATQFVLKVMPQLTALIRRQMADERAGKVAS